MAAVVAVAVSAVAVAAFLHKLLKKEPQHNTAKVACRGGHGTGNLLRHAQVNRCS